jgi:hypothetical protein
MAYDHENQEWDIFLSIIPWQIDHHVIPRQEKSGNGNPA